MTDQPTWKDDPDMAVQKWAAEAVAEACEHPEPIDVSQMAEPFRRMTCPTCKAQWTEPR